MAQYMPVTDTPQGPTTDSAMFTQRMNEVVKAGFITPGLALGKELGLFKAMCKVDKPATAQCIADAAVCKER